MASGGEDGRPRRRPRDESWLNAGLDSSIETPGKDNDSPHMDTGLDSVQSPGRDVNSPQVTNLSSRARVARQILALEKPQSRHRSPEYQHAEESVYETLVRELDRLSSVELEKMYEIQEELGIDNRRLIAENETLKERVTALEAGSGVVDQELSKENAKLRQKLEDSKEREQDLQRQVREARVKEDRLEGSLLDLNKSLLHVRMEWNDLKDMYDTLERQKTADDARLADVAEERGLHNKEMDHLRKELEAARAELKREANLHAEQMKYARDLHRLALEKADAEHELKLNQKDSEISRIEELLKDERAERRVDAAATAGDIGSPSPSRHSSSARLQNEAAELQSELEDTRGELLDVKREKARAEAALKSKLHDAVEGCSVAKDHAARLEESLRRRDKDIEQYREQLDKAEVNRQRLMDEMYEVEQRARDEQESSIKEKRKAVGALTSTEDKLFQLSDLLSSLQEQHDRMKDENKAMKEAHDEDQRKLLVELQGALEESSQLKRDVSAAQRDKKALLAEIRDLEDEMKEKAASVREMRNRVAEAERYRDQAKDRAAQARHVQSSSSPPPDERALASHRALEEEVERLESVLEKRSKQLNKLNDDLLQSEDAYVDLVSERDVLKRRVERSEQDKQYSTAKAQRALKETEATIQSLSGKLAALVTQNEEMLTAQREDLVHEQQVLATKHAQAVAERDVTKAMHKRALEDVGRLEGELHNVRGQLRDAEDNLITARSAASAPAVQVAAPSRLSSRDRSLPPAAESRREADGSDKAAGPVEAAAGSVEAAAAEEVAAAQAKARALERAAAEAEAEVDALRAEADDLQDTLRRERGRASTLDQEVAQRAEQVDRLLADLAQATERCTVLLEEKAALQQQVAASLEEQQKLKTRARRAEDARESTEERVTRLADTVDRLQAGLSNLSAEHEAAAREHDATQRKLAAEAQQATLEAASLQEEVQRGQQERAGLRKEVRELHHELEQKGADLQDVSERLAHLRAEQKTLRNERDTLRQQVHAEQTAKKTLERRASKAADVIKDTQLTINTLNHKFDALQTQHDVFTEQQIAKEELAAQHMAQLNNELSRVDKDAAEAKRQRHALELEKVELEARVARLEDSLKQRDAQVARLRGRLQEAEGERDMAYEDVGALRDKLKKEKARHIDIVQEIEAAELVLDDTEAQLESVEARAAELDAQPRRRRRSSSRSESVEKEMEELRQQKAALERERDGLEEQLERLDNLEDTSKVEESQLQKDLDRLSREHEDLSDECARLRSELAAEEHERAAEEQKKHFEARRAEQAMSALAEADRGISALVVKMRALESDHADAEGSHSVELARLRGEVEQQRAEFYRLEGEKAQLEGDVDELRAKLTSRNERLEQMASMSNDAEVVSRLADRAEELRKELHEAEAAHAEVVQERDNLVTERDDLKRAQQSSRKEREQLSEKLRDVESEAEQHVYDKDGLNAEIEKIHAYGSLKDALLEKMGEDLKEMESELEAIEEERDELEQLLDAANDRIKNLEQSMGVSPDVSALQSQLTKSTVEHETARTRASRERDSLLEEKADLERKLLEARSRESAALKEAQAARKRIEELEAQVDESESERHRLVSENEMLMDANSAARAEALPHARVVELERQAEEQEHEISRLEVQLAQASSSPSKKVFLLERQVEDKEAEIARLEGALTRAQAQRNESVLPPVDRHVATSESVSRPVSSLTRDYAARAPAAREDDGGEVTRLRSMLVEAEAQQGALERQLEAARGAEKRAREAEAEQRAQARAARGRAEDVVARTEGRVQSLQGELTDLREKHDRILAREQADRTVVERRCTQLVKESDALKAEVRKYSSDLYRIEAQRDALEAEVEAVEAERDQLKHRGDPNSDRKIRRSEARLDALSKELEELQSEHEAVTDNLYEEKEKLAAKLKAERMSRLALEVENSKLGDRVATLRVQVDALDSLKVSLEEEQWNLLTEQKRLEMALSASNMAHNSKDADTQRLEKELKETKAHVATVRAEHGAVVQELAVEADKLRDEVNRRDAPRSPPPINDVASLRRDNEYLSARVEKLRAEVDETSKREARAASDLAALRGENALLSEAVARSAANPAPPVSAPRGGEQAARPPVVDDAEVRLLRDRVVRLRATVENQQQQIEDLERRKESGAADVELQLNDLRAEVRSLEAYLSKITSERDALKREARHIKEERRAMQKRGESMQQAISEWDARLSSILGKLADLEREHDVVVAELAREQELLRRAEPDNDSQVTIDRLTHQVSTLEKEVDGLERDNRNLSLQVAEVPLLQDRVEEERHKRRRAEEDAAALLDKKSTAGPRVSVQLQSRVEELEDELDALKDAQGKADAASTAVADAEDALERERLKRRALLDQNTNLVEQMRERNAAITEKSNLVERLRGDAERLRQRAVEAEQAQDDLARRNVDLVAASQRAPPPMVYSEQPQREKAAHPPRQQQSMRSQHEEQTGQRDSSEKIRRLESERHRLESDLQRLLEESERLDVNAAEMASLRREAGRNRQEAQSLEGKLQLKEEELAEVQGEVQHLHEDIESLRAQKDITEKRLRDEQDSRENVEDNARRSHRVIAEHCAKLETLLQNRSKEDAESTRLLGEIADLQQRCRSLTADRETMRGEVCELLELRRRCEALDEDREALKDEVRALDVSSIDQREAIARLSKELARREQDDEDRAVLQRHLKEVQGALEGKTSELREVEGELDTLTRERDELAEELQESERQAQAEILKLREEVAMLQEQLSQKMQGAASDTEVAALEANLRLKNELIKRMEVQLTAAQQRSGLAEEVASITSSKAREIAFLQRRVEQLDAEKAAIGLRARRSATLVDALNSELVMMERLRQRRAHDPEEAEELLRLKRSLIDRLQLLPETVASELDAERAAAEESRERVRAKMAEQLDQQEDDAEAWQWATIEEQEVQIDNLKAEREELLARLSDTEVEQKKAERENYEQQKHFSRQLAQLKRELADRSGEACSWPYLQLDHNNLHFDRYESARR